MRRRATTVVLTSILATLVLAAAACGSTSGEGGGAPASPVTIGGESGTERDGAAGAFDAAAGPSGALDRSFGDGGYVHVSIAEGAAIWTERLAMFARADGSHGVAVSTLGSGVAEPGRVVLYDVSAKGEIAAPRDVAPFGLALVPQALHLGADVLLAGASLDEYGYPTDGPTRFLRDGAAGALAPSFATAVVDLPAAQWLHTASDGRVVVVGTERRSDDNVKELRAARLTRDGALDASYGPRGRRALEGDEAIVAPTDVAIDGQGRLLLLFTSAVTSPAVTRLRPDGTRDTSFGSGGRVVLEALEKGQRGRIAVDGRDRAIVVTESHEAGALGIHARRIDASGALDATFTDVDDARRMWITQLLVDDEGAVFVVGKSLLDSLSLNDGLFAATVLRLERDGGLSTGFGEGGRIVLLGAPTTGPGALHGDFGPGRSLTVLVAHVAGDLHGRDARAPKGLGFSLARITR